MNMSKLLRILAFVGGAIGAVVEAIELAQRADAQVTPTHLYAAGFLAAVMFALKWPGDMTAREAQELEARVKRESILPPPSQETRDMVDMLRDAKIKEREP